jgi:FlaA1/EpsC-like NDP-sugar epimerase
VGVPVRGAAADLPALIAKLELEEIVISSPAINGETEARVRAICAARAVEVRRLVFELK